MTRVTSASLISFISRTYGDKASDKMILEQNKSFTKKRDYHDRQMFFYIILDNR